MFKFNLTKYSFLKKEEEKKENLADVVVIVTS